MSVNSPASWSAQVLRMQPGFPSGIVALFQFALRKADLMSATVITMRSSVT